MPVKSVIEVDVDDAAFQRFTNLFEEYRQHLRDMPGDWARVNDVAGESTDISEQMIAALMTQTQLMSEMVASGQKITNSATKEASTFDAMAKSTKSVATNLAHATGSILRWGTITGVIGGLLGAGAGLFGLEKLGRDATDIRRDARGYNASPGAVSALRTNYAPFGNADHLLGGIADTQSSLADSWIAAVNGIRDAGAPPDQLASQYQDSARQLYKDTRNSPGMLETLFQSRGLNRFFDLDEVRRLGSTSDEEYAKYKAQTAADTKQFGLKDDDLRKWQEFNVQLGRAGTLIENSFIKALSPLAPQLTQASEILAAFIGHELTAPKVEEWVRGISRGLGWLNDKLGDPSLETKFDHLVDNAEGVAQGLGDLLRMLGLLPADKTASGSSDAPATPGSPGKGAAPSTWQEVGKIGRWLGSAWLDGDERSPDASGKVYGDAGFDPTTARGFRASPQPSAVEAAPLLRRLEQKDHLPDGILGAIYQQESHSGRDLMNTKSGAIGGFQFMRGTADQYHISNPMDFGQASQGAADYMRDLLREFKGDERKALAAYNDGPGNISALVKKFGATWESHLDNRETSDYVRSTTRMTAQRGSQPGQRVDVKISNNTGGAATVTARQAAI